MLPMIRSRFAAPALFESSLEPWSDLRREIDRLFDSVAWTPLAANGTPGMQSWVPPMDVEDQENLIRVSFEIPGVNREDVTVTVENGVLTVAGEKRVERRSGDEKSGSQSIERRYGRFERSLALPQTIEADNVSAQYENGVLTLELPKSAESRKRRIAIDWRKDGAQKRIESTKEAKA
jgi:HSP20 family protein